MKINENLSITRHTDGTYTVVTPKRASIYNPTSPEYVTIKTIYETARIDRGAVDTSMLDIEGAEIPAPTVDFKKTLGQFIKFFSEFHFEPNFRFVNTFTRALGTSSTKGMSYVTNYFELIDSPYKNEIKEKTKSPEFEEIVRALATATPSKCINSRLKLYYGSAGTGKTTKAVEETKGKCIVCNSAMLPADLMEDFTFVDGKATFKPSTLWRAMEEGIGITFDEINLLPFESLRFLQTILDGKSEFIYKGHTVHIAEGFYIIGTMNLSINGMTYGLPEPLVDRCSDIQSFKLTEKDLLCALE